MWNELRKLLGRCDLPTLLYNVTFMLRAAGLDVDSRFEKRISRPLLLISVAIAACYFYVYLFSMVWFVIWRADWNTDMISVVIVFSIGVTSEIGNTKLICMMYYRKEIKDLVNCFLACDALVKPDSRFARNLMASLRHVKKRAVIFWLVIVGNGVIYSVKPLLTPGRHLPEDAFIIYGLEPVTLSPNYEIASILMAAGNIVTFYLPANINAFFIILTGYIESQMMALSEEVVNLWSDAQNYCEQQLIGSSCSRCRNILQLHLKHNEVVNVCIEENLIEIIKIHKTSMMFSIRVESIYRVAIALEFSLLIIGLIAELLGGLENTYLLVPFALMQVGMDCFTGQRLMDSSIRFMDAVYASGWENFNSKNMKTVLLMLKVSQKSLRLSAGGVANLDFCCFMTVIRSTYSAYTTLRSTM